MSDSDTAVRLRLALAEQIDSPDWRHALEAVPRELFLGDAVYRYESGRGWVPVRRSEMSAEDWLTLAYTDETWVTQLNGVLAEDATEPVLISRPTSSSTFPGLVVLMLEAAGISEGDTVLEIGTGTGYSTSLMCHRLGDKAVTSIEYDPVVAARAKAAIAGAGYAPTLVHGDGLLGYGGNAPYDRLIATCAVRTIPLAWLEQVRSGGTITAPMKGWIDGAAFAHLRVAEDGSASGRFLGDDVYFMTARSHLPPPQPPLVMGRGEVSEGRVDPSMVRDNATAQWVAQLAVPQMQLAWAEDIATLFDSGTGSQADVSTNPNGGWTVYQHGPLRLWDAVEDAILMWQATGSPHQSAFGLTVTRDRQYVWLGEPDGQSWDLPA
ncbi:ATP-grasp peptide maturase system methyltransferase [Streptosporangium subroseum]|uniref:ATP-grasp peptide maturase system methyltransferase n=1 Tax=Streptosporangium subroseum TaxID=106412 RepID=UPI0030932F40|nr:ATP-grasp peptide maturase system methyltransferase [Streptosporangium subroseum]